ncbi:BQ5605_C002g01734 [Microbotryum silenes-dioicae]|uniref:BQ5605_C002g01734 protein n=1 Tax=Microbotryum silenes-dioicae TaxID=796604 RepID=A0A2X0NX17_9BASI|nr:BQ5605_C002g01734 [Microbotryum silenes-dioicae]
MSFTTAFNGISAKIKQSYSKASISGACLYTDSELIELDDRDTGIPFELRYAPQLAKKPTAAKDSESGSTNQPKPAPRDPFAEPYPEPDLYVHEEEVKEDPSDASGDIFVLLLNKFCIVPRHFLLVTKEFEKQERPLTPLQLLATYSVLKSLGTREKHLAFYNCGPLSGASQPHKHVQFIPLSNGVAPFDNFIQDNKPSNPKDPFQLPLPYTSFTVMLAPPLNGDLVSYLGMTFLSLLDLMIEHLRRASLVKSSSEGASSDPSTTTAPPPLSSRGGLSGLSYNLIMTEKYLQIIPRSKESWSASGSQQQISVNSLGFAGMLLVKDEEILEEVKKVGVMSILKEVGVDPVVSGELGEEVQDEE